MNRPTTAPRTPLSRERVLRAAIAFADEHGVETLSDTVLAPIPRQVWPGKPWKTQTLLIDHFYGTSPGGGCVTLCPAFSFVGEVSGQIPHCATTAFTRR